MLKYKEIIDTIAGNTDTDPATVRSILKALNCVIKDELADENPCRIYGLGTFTPVKSKKRIGRNPQTGDNIRISAKFRLRFRPGKDLKSGLQHATVVNDLREMANLMVSELLLYNSSEIDEGIKNNDLDIRLNKQLADARENFRKRVPEGITDSESIFESAWLHFIRKRTRAISVMS